MNGGARKEGLSRRHRYSGRGSFSAAMRGPLKVRGTSLLLHIATGKAGVSRMGVAVAKRLAPRAVDRNRLKRLAREAFRRHPLKSAGMDIVVVPRERFAPEAEGSWLAELRDLFDRIAGGRR